MGEPGTDLVTVQVQSLRIALKARLIREIVGARPWIPVPGARRELPGIVMWSGRAMSFLDLAHFSPKLTALQKGQQRERTVIVQAERFQLALPVDHVSEVWRLQEATPQACEINDFELAQEELAHGDDILPLFQPSLLLARLGLGAAA